MLKIKVNNLTKNNITKDKKYFYKKALSLINNTELELSFTWIEFKLIWESKSKNMWKDVLIII